MAERLHYEVDGDADNAISRAIRQLQRIAAADDEHIEINIDVTFSEPGPEPFENVSVEFIDDASPGRDTALSSFADDEDDDLDDEPDQEIDDGADDEDDEDDGRSRRTGYSSGKISSDDRELKEPEVGSQYHEVLTELQDLGATSREGAVTVKDLDLEKNAASPSLSTLFRYQMLERDDSSPPYDYWVSQFGLAYLAAHGRADDHETDDVAVAEGEADA